MKKILLAALLLLVTAAAAIDDGSPVTIVPPEKEVPFGLLRVEVDVKPPATKVEFFLDDRKVITRNRPPYTVEIDLGKLLIRHTVRAVGYDANGAVVGSDSRIVNEGVEPKSAGTEGITVALGVLDERDRPVPSLGKDDVQVLEDGAAMTVLAVEPAGGLPLTLGIVLDGSARMKDTLPALRETTTRFVTSMVGEKDQAFVVHFRDSASLTVPVTGKVSSLVAAVGDVRAMGGSALWDAMILALYQFHDARRALLVLTEGEDTNSRAERGTLLDYARRASAPIYVVGVNVPILEFSPKARLKELAEATGGAAFFVRGKKGLKEVPAILAKIEADIRAKYLVRFQPGPRRAGSAFQPITVRLARPGLKVRTVAGYVP